MKHSSYVFNSKLGNLRILGDQNTIITIKETNSPTTKTKYINFLLAEKEINQYLNSKITSFTFSIKPVGTIFQKKVWMELMKIKYGKIGSYLGIANKLNTSPRAIGNACSKNPCLLVIPCHRIISISGNIGGFRLGINIKKELISMEMHKKYRL